MTRGTALGLGAIYGGILGPALGGVLVPLISLLSGRAHFSSSEAILAIGASAFGGIIWFGGPGFLVGMVGSLTVKYALENARPLIAFGLPPVIGALTGLLAVGIFDLIFMMQPMTDLWPFFIAAATAGTVMSTIFGRQVRSSCVADS